MQKPNISKSIIHILTLILNVLGDIENNIYNLNSPPNGAKNQNTISSLLQWEWCWYTNTLHCM